MNTNHERANDTLWWTDVIQTSALTDSFCNTTNDTLWWTDVIQTSALTDSFCNTTHGCNDTLWWTDVIQTSALTDSFCNTTHGCNNVLSQVFVYTPFIAQLSSDGWIQLIAILELPSGFLTRTNCETYPKTSNIIRTFFTIKLLWKSGAYYT